MHEVKIMLDDSEFQVLTEQAEQNHRSLRAQAKHLVVGTKPYQRTRRPSKPVYGFPDPTVPYYGEPVLTPIATYTVGNDDGEN